VGWERAADLVAYHSAVAGQMTEQRTALESAIIPVSNYIMVSSVECWHRQPDMIRRIDAAMPADAIGRSGRYPGTRVNHVHLWSLANIYLTGRALLTQMQLLGALPDWVDDPEPTAVMLDFWERAAAAYRGDGHLQSWDAGFVTPAYDSSVIDELLAGVRPVGNDEREDISRFLATMYAWLFLLFFETRVGVGDTGPYQLGAGRTLVVRDLYALDGAELPWADVAKGVPYRNLTAALVLDGVHVQCDDWGTSVTDPADWAPHLSAFGLFTTDGDGSLRPVPGTELADIVATVRSAQRQHYRDIVGMTRDERIRCGAHVYFSLIRPFAETAGVADELDWDVPQACNGPLYDLIANLDLAMLPARDPATPYYPPLVFS
jgi:hypothetical protein